jgi:hypothetical protein
MSNVSIVEQDHESIMSLGTYSYLADREKFYRFDTPGGTGQTCITLQPVSEHVALLWGSNDNGDHLDLSERFRLDYYRTIIEENNNPRELIAPPRFQSVFEQQSPRGGFIMVHWEFGGLLYYKDEQTNDWVPVIRFTKMKSIHIAAKGGFHHARYVPAPLPPTTLGDDDDAMEAM